MTEQPSYGTPHRVQDAAEVQDKKLGRRDTHRGVTVDVCGQLSDGTVVSVWENGQLVKFKRFEHHWWGGTRLRKAERLARKWRDEYPTASRSYGGWRFFMNNW